ncbi:MAG: hypothetical protein FRX49_02539 [Trebouxia sp. A1-2]|nr:MAG: hypothetical protein FRX49_02539 [Trebouxia sp. A1-2]
MTGSTTSALGGTKLDTSERLSQSLVSLRQAGLNAVALIHNNGLPFNRLQLADVAGQGIISDEDYIWLNHLHEHSNHACALASNTLRESARLTAVPPLEVDNLALGNAQEQRLWNPLIVDVGFTYPLHQGPSPAKNSLHNRRCQRHPRHPSIRVYQGHLTSSNVILIIPACPSRLALCPFVALQRTPLAGLGWALAAPLCASRSAQSIYMRVAPACTHKHKVDRSVERSNNCLEQLESDHSAYDRHPRLGEEDHRNLSVHQGGATWGRAHFSRWRTAAGLVGLGRAACSAISSSVAPPTTFFVLLRLGRFRFGICLLASGGRLLQKQKACYGQYAQAYNTSVERGGEEGRLHAAHWVRHLVVSLRILHMRKQSS